MSSRRHFHRSESYECGEGATCRWIPIAAALIGGGLSYLSAREQARAQQDAFNPPESGPALLDEASPHAELIMQQAANLYKQGAFAPPPDPLELAGRQSYLDYTQEQLPQLIGAARESWMRGLDPGIDPYLPEMVREARADLARSYAEDIMPRIKTSAQATGGFGGSRQGVAEGIASRSLLDAQTEVETRLRSAAYNNMLAQQQGAWGMTSPMLQFGFLSPQAQMQIGEMRRQDEMDKVQNLMGYSNLMSPWTQPYQRNVPAYMEPVGANPYTSALQGAATGLELYNMYNQYANPSTPTAAGATPVGTYQTQQAAANQFLQPTQLGAPGGGSFGGLYS